MQLMHIIRIFALLVNLHLILARFSEETLPASSIPVREENIEDDEYIYLVMGGHRAVTMSRIRAMVSIRSIKHTVAFGDNHICSGTVISVSLVLTAAHCLVDRNGVVTLPHRILVAVGTPRRLKRRRRSKLYNVYRIQPHPKYVRGGLHNIAVLYLSEAIDMNVQGCTIANLPEKIPQIDDPVSTLGWGQLLPDGPYSDVAQEIYLRIQSPVHCNEKTMLSDHLCVLDLNHTNRRLCRGDSGSPLFWNDMLVGISAIEVECSHQITWGMQFVNISIYKSWLKREDFNSRGVSLTLMIHLIPIYMVLLQLYGEIIRI